MYLRNILTHYPEIHKCAAQCVGWLAHSKAGSDLHRRAD